jgi:bacteriocin leader peptide (microcyclamide/patellamide family)
MDKKNLMSQVAHPINKLTVQDLPIELAELSDEALSQILGGQIWGCGRNLEVQLHPEGPIRPMRWSLRIESCNEFPYTDLIF